MSKSKPIAGDPPLKVYISDELCPKGMYILRRDVGALVLTNELCGALREAKFQALLEELTNDGE